MKTDLKQEILKLIERGATVTSACRKLNIHRSTFYDWRNADAEFLQKLVRAEAISREETDDAASYHYHRLVREGDPKFLTKWLDQQHPRFARKAMQLVFRREDEMEGAVSSMDKEELFVLIRAYHHAGFKAIDTLDEKTQAEFVEWYKKHSPDGQGPFRPHAHDVIAANVMRNSLKSARRDSSPDPS